MCGIISYIGKNKALPILLDGLKYLEYRGYDSSGIAYSDNNKITLVKSVGKINNLIDKVDKNINSYMGIGHTRWATHGGVNLENCHPHTQRNVTIVHNGIIENYLELKEKLLRFCYEFKSDTDSEVVCALIDFYYNDTHDEIKSLKKVMDELVGSYAISVIFNNDLEHIYAIRKDSPIIIGISDSGNFISSDINAIRKYTNKYILLDVYEIAKLSKDNVFVYKDDEIINKDIYTSSHELDEIELLDYKHYMIKEIHEIPSLIKNNLFETTKNIPDISKYNNIYIVGCGSTYHAGLIGKYLMEEYANKMVNVMIASEFRYSKLFLKSDDLVILISQSGETADTLASLRIANEYGATTLSIVNVVGSSIARESDIVLYTNARTEIAVATTKAYVMQVYMLGLLSIKASNINYNDMVADYKKLVYQIDSVLNNEDAYKEVANKICNCDDVFFLGRGIDYALCMEGSLKLKEISYIHSEAYPAGELKHGTISLIDDGMPVISLITNNKIKDKMLSNIKEVISRGAKSYIICTDDIDIDDIYYDMIIKVPSSTKVLKPILTIIPLQLISYYVALLNDRDIDKPRNLAKSVTVE